MTDKQQFEELMKLFKVPLILEGDTLTITPDVNTPIVIGYTGFEAQFSFTAEGQFVNVGVWE